MSGLISQKGRKYLKVPQLELMKIFSYLSEIKLVCEMVAFGRGAADVEARGPT